MRTTCSFSLRKDEGLIGANNYPEPPALCAAFIAKNASKTTLPGTDAIFLKLPPSFLLILPRSRNALNTHTLTCDPLTWPHLRNYRIRGGEIPAGYFGETNSGRRSNYHAITALRSITPRSAVSRLTVWTVWWRRLTLKKTIKIIILF